MICEIPGQAEPTAFRNYILVEISESSEIPEHKELREETSHNLPSQAETPEQGSPWEDALFPLLALGVAVYLAQMWWSDFKAKAKGEDVKGALPGTTPCPPLAIYIGICGALVLLIGQILGEYGLDLVAEQSDIVWLFLLQMIAAAVWEEVIFRGFLVIENRGKQLLLGSIIVVSLIFAIGHPHLWSLDFPEGVSAWQFWKGDLEFHWTTKAFYSTGWLFVMSLWFYWMRFASFNPKRSLLPCMAAHLAYNLGVFITKLAQGHVVGLY